MVKSYLRFVPTPDPVLGVVSSASEGGSVCYDERDKLAVVPALSRVIVWNMRVGSVVRTLEVPDLEATVTTTTLSPSGDHVAVGYSDGVVRVWAMVGSRCLCTFAGHRSAVTALCYSADGSRIASGSSDTTVIVWDVVTQRGLFRLKGHKAPVTCCHFLERSDSNALVSGSKDTLVKVWDLSTQHCVQTVVGHRSEVWSVAVDAREERMYSGSVEPNVRVWELRYPELTGEESLTDLLIRGSWLQTQQGIPEISLIGFVPRNSSERVLQLSLSPSGAMLGVLGKEKYIELFAVYSGTEREKRTKKRVARLMRKRKSKGNDGDENLVTEEERAPIAADELVFQQKVMAGSVIRSFAFSRTPSEAHVLLSLVDNQLLLVELSPTESKKIGEVSRPGHPSDVRALALSSDGNQLVSTSQRTKSGRIDIYQVSSGELVNSIEAHEGAVWSIVALPEEKGIISGGADKELKFWSFDLVKAERSSARTLSLALDKSVVMEDGILAAVVSKDAKFVAVSLLDHTVRVFYLDTLKFFVSLYGHKLPVLSLDISADSLLLITASADKNVKIWGLDFGECRKSLFAHDDSVMQVKFVGDTHHFLSCGKDGLIKYWDADKIHVLRGHTGEVWALCTSSSGKTVFSGSHDRSVRMWEQGYEQVFVDEEEEIEMDKMFEADMNKEEEEEFRPDDMDLESAMAGKRDLDSIKAGERIIEALELVEAEELNWSGYREALRKAKAERPPEEVERIESEEGWDTIVPPPAPSAFLRGKTPSEYLLDLVVSVRPDVLEQALLVLNFSTSVVLLSHLATWIEQERRLELSFRCLYQLLQQHHSQIVSSTKAAPVLVRLQDSARKVIRKHKDLIGMNVAAIKFVKREMQANSTAQLFRLADKVQRARERDLERAEQHTAKKRRIAL